jgi:inosine-uridine nucleoside N-ribohydrolase
VIIDTDAKNEADDQFAIVHAILTKSFDLRGIIPAHFGSRVPDSMQASHDEVALLLRLMGREGAYRVEPGARVPLVDTTSPRPSPGSDLIVEEAMRDDPRRLYIAFYGPLTEMASALLTEPRIAERPVTVVWIGGGPWPAGGPEFNLSNDIHAANVVFKSSLDVWQIPQPVYRKVAVSYAELVEKVAPHGAIGAYLVEQLIEWNERRSDPDGPSIEYRSLGDSPAVGVIIYPDGGDWHHMPAPEFEPSMHYRHTGANRPIRVYTTFDARFLLEDFFAKLAQFNRETTR